MEIHLPLQIEEMLNRHIESGRYESAPQAICQAIFLLDELAEWEDENFPTEYRRQMLQESIDSGPSSLSAKELFDELLERSEVSSKDKDNATA